MTIDVTLPPSYLLFSTKTQASKILRRKQADLRPPLDIAKNAKGPPPCSEGPFVSFNRAYYRPVDTSIVLPSSSIT
jgi:hypothetical protein